MVHITMWMTGVGVRPGIVYGETDDFSYNIIDCRFDGSGSILSYASIAGPWPSKRS
jgi:hypothetical protein